VSVDRLSFRGGPKAAERLRPEKNKRIDFGLAFGIKRQEPRVIKTGGSSVVNKASGKFLFQDPSLPWERSISSV
jgi:hypothetical protein